MTEIRFPCDLCGRKVQCGGGIYNLVVSKKFGMSFCKNCKGANWDGIVPQMHPTFMQRLVDEGKDTTLNKNGWLDLY